MLVIASDGSGESDKSDQAAGFGVVMHDTDSGWRASFNGYIAKFNVASAKIVNGKMIFEYLEQSAPASNNRGELSGFLFSILLAKERNAAEFVSVMDSTYCINTFKVGGWLENWIKKDIVNTKKNVDLIMLIYTHLLDIKVHFFHQRAHLPKATIQRLNGLDRLYADLNALADTEAETGKITARTINIQPKFVVAYPRNTKSSRN